MYGGVCTGENAIGHINATKLFLDRGIGYNWQFLYNESLITRARNGLVKMFYQTDCTHLLFIDADISYRAEDIVSMIDADKDIICGVYPKKRIAWERINDALAKGIIGEDLKHYTGDLVINKLNYVDTPIADTSIVPLFSLSEYAATTHKVCLTGDGGDELFGGYVTYQATYLNEKIRSASNLVSQLKFI